MPSRSPSTGASAAAVVKVLKAAGIETLSGNSLDYEGVRVTNGKTLHKDKEVTVSIEVAFGTDVSALSAECQQALEAEGYQVRLNPSNDSILYITR